jgi:hypothetical protein
MKFLQLETLSIKEFAANDKAHSLNYGVVELMILHACDRAIFSKQKWILAMDLTISRERKQGTHLPRKEIVVLETEDGLDTFNVLENVTKMDEATRQLDLSVSVLSQYNLLSDNNLGLCIGTESCKI